MFRVRLPSTSSGIVISGAQDFVTVTITDADSKKFMFTCCSLTMILA